MTARKCSNNFASIKKTDVLFMLGNFFGLGYKGYCIKSDNSKFKANKIAATSDSGGEKPGENPPADDIYDLYFERVYQQLEEKNRRHFQQKFSRINDDIEKLKEIDKVRYRDALRKRHIMLKFLYGTSDNSFTSFKSEVAKGIDEALDRDSLRNLLESAWDEAERLSFEETFRDAVKNIDQTRESDPVQYLEFLKFRSNCIIQARLKNCTVKELFDFQEDLDSQDLFDSLEDLDSQEEDESSGDSDGDDNPGLG